MTQWGIPLEVLPSSSITPGPPVMGAVIDFGEVKDVHALQATITGFTGSGSIAAAIFGSLDGVNWYTNVDVANIPGAAGADGVYVNQSTIPARFVQAIAEVFSGSASATVEITVASGVS